MEPRALVCAPLKSHWNTCSPSAIFVFLLRTPLKCLVCENLRARYFIKDQKIRDPSRPNAKNTTGHRNCLTSWSLISVPTCPHHCSALTGLSCSKIDFTGSVAVTRTSQGPCSFLSVSDIEMYSQTFPFTFFISNLPAERTKEKKVLFFPKRPGCQDINLTDWCHMMWVLWWEI